jgi:putative transposase
MRLRELIRQTCARLEVYILSGHAAVDHIHLLLSMPPKLPVSELMQQIKGCSSRKLLEEFRDLKQQFWGKPIWARGCFAASSGNATDELIKQCIESQDQDFPPPGEGNFNIGE